MRVVLALMSRLLLAKSPNKISSMGSEVYSSDRFDALAQSLHYSTNIDLNKSSVGTQF